MKGNWRIMTIMQERAHEMIEQLPDDKVCYIVKLLEDLVSVNPKNDGITVEQRAYMDLQKFRRCSDAETDYKAELMEALEQKYADIN